jgi:peptidoglycan/xylan/chitin deacetylase (PgdA/CDA1 family)
MSLNSTDIPLRDFVGYGRTPPNAEWPNDARIAVSFVLNYEEGGEVSHGLISAIIRCRKCNVQYNPLNGDSRTEANLNERFGAAPLTGGKRDMAMESQYEYGSRAGVWRIMNLFDKHDMKVEAYATHLCCGTALILLRTRR